MDSATGKSEGGKEADAVHRLLDALESRRRSVWPEGKERGCFVPPPLGRLVGRETHVWTRHWAWRWGAGGGRQARHAATLQMATEPPGWAGFSKVTASAFRAMIGQSNTQSTGRIGSGAVCVCVGGGRPEAAAESNCRDNSLPTNCQPVLEVNLFLQGPQHYLVPNS